MNENIHSKLPKDNAKTPEDAIKKIRFDSKENIYMFKNDKQILRYRGEVNQIIILNSDLSNIHDSILVHNHPQGTPFSTSDIENVFQYNIREFILATHEYIYTIKRPQNGWNMIWNSDIVQERLEESKTLAEHLIFKMISQNEIPYYNADIEIIHYLWSSFFRMSNVQYTRTKY